MFYNFWDKLHREIKQTFPLANGTMIFKNIYRLITIFLSFHNEIALHFSKLVLEASSYDKCNASRESDPEGCARWIKIKDIRFYRIFLRYSIKNRSRLDSSCDWSCILLLFVLFFFSFCPSTSSSASIDTRRSFSYDDRV